MDSFFWCRLDGIQWWEWVQTCGICFYMRLFCITTLFYLWLVNFFIWAVNLISNITIDWCSFMFAYRRLWQFGCGEPIFGFLHRVVSVIQKSLTSIRTILLIEKYGRWKYSQLLFWGGGVWERYTFSEPIAKIQLD